MPPAPTPTPTLLPRAARAPRRRAGLTLLELAVVLTVLALLGALVAPPVARQLDRLAVTAAAADLAAALGTARDHAIAEWRPVAVRLDATGATVHAGPDTILRRELAGPHGVTVASTRDSMAYGLGGLGTGAANLSVVVARGRAAETVFVSRLGRVRW